MAASQRHHQLPLWQWDPSQHNHLWVTGGIPTDNDGLAVTLLNSIDYHFIAIVSFAEVSSWEEEVGQAFVYYAHGQDEAWWNRTLDRLDQAAKEGPLVVVVDSVPATLRSQATLRGLQALRQRGRCTLWLAHHHLGPDPNLRVSSAVGPRCASTVAATVQHAINDPAVYLVGHHADIPLGFVRLSTDRLQIPAAMSGFLKSIVQHQYRHHIDTE